VTFTVGRNARRSFCFGLVAIGLAAMAAVPAWAGPYIVMNANTGRVIAQYEAGQPWYPASISKLMTVLVTFRAIRDGRVKPDTLLTVSEHALAQAPTKMGFPVGTQVTVDNALKMLMVKSANDMAVVLAEGVGGTYDNFIAEMNRTAAELGMTGTHYDNPNGLPDDGQITTARDMAILAREIYREFPHYEALFRIPALRLGKRLIRNHNRLIDHYPGADGMKTGFICAGGFNIVATATRGSKRLIVVVLGGRSSASRNEDAAKLFEKGFSRLAPIAATLRNEPRSVEAIKNLAVAPIDMHDLVCGKKRNRTPIESDVEDDPEDEVMAAAVGPHGKKVKKSLLVDLPPSMQPVRVFIGPASQSEEKKSVSGDNLIPHRKIRKRGKRGKKRTVISLPFDEQIVPKSARASNGSSLIPWADHIARKPAQASSAPPANRAATQPVVNKPTVLESAAMYEGQPLPRDRHPGTNAKPMVITPPPAVAAANSRAKAPAKPNLGAIPQTARAFSASDSGPFGPDADSFVPMMVQPPMELPAIPPVPQPRPNP
jgi:D-alanyl-D-alanine carboxypeptidase